jgi:hypothetical protein
MSHARNVEQAIYRTFFSTLVKYVRLLYNWLVESDLGYSHGAT